MLVCLIVFLSFLISVLIFLFFPVQDAAARPSVCLSLLNQLLLCLREQTEAELIGSHFRYLISARLLAVASSLPLVSRQQLWIWPHPSSC